MPRIARFLMLPSLLLALSAGCQAPTEIMLDVRTNLDCTDEKAWHGVAIYVGKPGADERSQAPVLGTAHCDGAGHIGSLVITPSAGKDELVGIRVVAAGAEAKGQPEDCAANDYEGCIVARRAVRFGPHARLDINVELTQDCVSRGCDPEHSCKTGSCVDVPVETETSLAEPTPSPPTSSMPRPTHTVRCGDDGVRCSTTGDVCCLHVDVPNQTSTGQCLPSEDCPSEDIVLNCDDDTDCSDKDSAQGPGLCWLNWSEAPTGHFTPSKVGGSQCLSPEHQFERSTVGLALCETRQPCRNQSFECVASTNTTPDVMPPDNQLPNYHWCVVAKNNPAP